MDRRQELKENFYREHVEAKWRNRPTSLKCLGQLPEKGPCFRTCWRNSCCFFPPFSPAPLLGRKLKGNGVQSGWAPHRERCLSWLPLTPVLSGSAALLSRIWGQILCNKVSNFTMNTPFSHYLWGYVPRPPSPAVNALTTDGTQPCIYYGFPIHIHLWWSLIH